MITLILLIYKGMSILFFSIQKPDKKPGTAWGDSGKKL
jgi:hypothetical protein